ncbi:craniofacial development protein 2 [Biomphalaria glabrata]|nr:craniofacial development protein 2 [Biomphalaria glabrata]
MESFYADLSRVLCKVDAVDKLIIMCGFNARVGSDYSAWPCVLGRDGIGSCNDNGRLLLELEDYSELISESGRKPQDDDPVSNWSQLKTILHNVTAKVVGVLQ